MPTLLSKTPITVDGLLNDWTLADEIDFGDVPSYSVFARAEGDFFYFRITGPVPIGANTTIWFNTDQNTTTGFEIFGFAGGAEYNVTIYNQLQPDGTTNSPPRSMLTAAPRARR